MSEKLGSVVIGKKGRYTDPDYLKKWRKKKSTTVKDKYLEELGEKPDMSGNTLEGWTRIILKKEKHGQ